MARSERLRLFTVAVSLVSLFLLVAACDTGDPPSSSTSTSRRSTVVDSATRPVRAVEGSTPSGPSSFTAVGVPAGQPYWSGLTAIAAEPGRNVIVVDAQPLTSEGVRDAAVYLGRRGIDGKTGATAIRPPGAGEAGITGNPVAARAVDLTVGTDWVVYVVGTLAPGDVNASLLGARLTLRDDAGDHVVDVMSPTQLCADAPTDASPPGGATSPDTASAIPPRCRDYQSTFRAAALTEFGVDVP